MPSEPIRVFVDESGDPGTGGSGRSTRWLVLGAVAELGPHGSFDAFAAELQLALQQHRSAGPVHFGKLTARAKIPVYVRLASVPGIAIVVASDTTALRPASALRDPRRHYRYAVRFVVERASQLGAALKRPIEVTFEQSQHVDIGSVRDYLSLIRSEPQSRGWSAMKWEWIDVGDIRMASKQDQSPLWLADGVAHAYFQALEAEPITGGPVAVYGDVLQPLLWRGPSDAGIDGHGFTFLPTTSTEEFVKEFPHIRMWIRRQMQVAPLLWNYAPKRHRAEGG